MNISKLLCLQVCIVLSGCAEHCDSLDEIRKWHEIRQCKELEKVKGDDGVELITFSCPTYYGTKVIDYTIKDNVTCYKSTFEYRNKGNETN